MPVKDRYDDVVLVVTTAINHRDFSVVEVALAVDGTDSLPAVIKGIGHSKRTPVDKPNPALGFDIALGRAIENLGRAVTRRAKGRVKQLDDLAFQQDLRALKLESAPKTKKVKKAKKSAVKVVAVS